MKTKDQRDNGQQGPLNPGTIPPSDHAFQLLCMHPETLKAWEDALEADGDMDPEHARKLAAVRTELLKRRIQQDRAVE